MLQEITVPDIGEGVESGKVVAIHVKTGETIKADDTVIELETDKAVVEIPSPVEGKVAEVLVSEGDDVKIGDVIAKVETEDGEAGTSAEESDDSVQEKAEAEKDEDDHDEAERDEDDSGEGPDAEARDREPAEEQGQDAPESEAREERDESEVTEDNGGKEKDSDDQKASEDSGQPRAPAPASPSIRRLARELGVDIHALEGSGPGGRITESDVKAFVRKARTSAEASAAAGPGKADLPDFKRWGDVKEVELETVRRLTAESTATSWRMVPHVTQFDKADITSLEAFIKTNAAAVEKAGGKLTITAILARVCAEALKRFPRFNTSIDMQRGVLIYKKYVHIGIAVDTPRGLFMPVIANADAKSITELAVDIVDLARRSRDKKIKPSELEGGTFSISNQGGIGGVGFTPIVLWPQVAILGVSRSAVEPVAQDGAFVARNILPLSLSYDHRVIDGADAARFLRWVCVCLEQPMTLFLD